MFVSVIRPLTTHPFRDGAGRGGGVIFAPCGVRCVRFEPLYPFGLGCTSLELSAEGLVSVLMFRRSFCISIQSGGKNPCQRDFIHHNPFWAPKRRRNDGIMTPTRRYLLGSKSGHFCSPGQGLPIKPVLVGTHACCMLRLGRRSVDLLPVAQQTKAFTKGHHRQDMGLWS